MAARFEGLQQPGLAWAGGFAAAFLPPRVFPAAAGTGGANRGVLAAGRSHPVGSCSFFLLGEPLGDHSVPPSGSVRVAGSRLGASRFRRNFLLFCDFYPLRLTVCVTGRTEGGSGAEKPPPLRLPLRGPVPEPRWQAAPSLCRP